ncbi:MAG: acyloxyacyl hydrolase [Gammaproteobacteria bacterium]
MLKKTWSLLLGLLLAPLAHATLLDMDAMTFTVGYWGDSTNRHGLRAAGRWDWDVVWLQQSPIQLTGYWEGGFGYWQANTRHSDENSHLFITSASPILQIWLGPVDLKQNRFFFELGIGPSYFSDNTLGAKDFGSLWHFEDKFGAGFNFGTTQPAQVIFRYYHYSNAGLIGPNEGLDLFTLGIVWFF